MKKILLLILTIVILAGVCACGTQNEPLKAAETEASVQSSAPEERIEDLLCAEEWVSHESPWRMTWDPDGSGVAVHKYSGKQMTVFNWSIREDGRLEVITPSDKINDLTFRLTEENGVKTLITIENDCSFVRVSDYQKSEYDIAYEKLTYYEQDFIRKNALLLKMHFGDGFDPDQLTLYSVIENEKGIQVAASDGGAIHKLRIDMGMTNGTIFYLGDYASEDEISDIGIFDLNAVNQALRLYFREKSAMSIAE